MKSALPAVLLLLLQCASSAPIAATTSHDLLLRLAATKINLDTQPTAIPDPYSARYPSTKAEEAAIKNTPYSHPESLPGSAVLASQQPLSSSSLRSLSVAAPASSKINRNVKDEVSRASRELAAKPTSALASMRKEDLDRYRAREGEKKKSKSAGVSGTVSKLLSCGNDILLPGNVYIKSQNMSQQTDIIIVGIVLLFLVLVVAIEGMEQIRGCCRKRVSTPNYDIKNRAIYLESMEAGALVAKK